MLCPMIFVVAPTQWSKVSTLVWGVLPKDIHYVTIYNINNTKVNLINNLDP